MDILTFIDEINNQISERVQKMEYVQAEDLQLDRRAAYRLHVNEDCIIVDKNTDRTLQYYGGFEYVDKEYRIEMGDYVVYLGDDDRVRGHIDYYYEREEEEEEVDMDSILRYNTHTLNN